MLRRRRLHFGDDPPRHDLPGPEPERQFLFAALPDLQSAVAADPCLHDPVAVVPELQAAASPVANSPSGTVNGRSYFGLDRSPFILVSIMP